VCPTPPPAGGGAGGGRRGCPFFRRPILERRGAGRKRKAPPAPRGAPRGSPRAPPVSGPGKRPRPDCKCDGTGPSAHPPDLTAPGLPKVRLLGPPGACYNAPPPRDHPAAGAVKMRRRGRDGEGGQRARPPPPAAKEGGSACWQPD